jgi:hypothetical protein
VVDADRGCRAARLATAPYDWPKRRPNAGAAFEYLIPAGLLAEPAAHPATDDGLVETGLTAELREQVAELAAHLGRAEGELAAELRRSSDLVATITALRAELAEARKGWLVRLVEAVRRR